MARVLAALSEGPTAARQGRFTGLRGPPLLRPPARPRPPPEAAAAATATPYPPRPPGALLRETSDQRPPRTRLSTANRQRGRDTSHTAELESDASPTSRGAHTPTSLCVGHAPSDAAGGEAGGRRPQNAGAEAVAAPPAPGPAPLRASVQKSPVIVRIPPYSGPPLVPCAPSPRKRPWEL